MTIKISRLEAVSARIFELAKQDPGKKAQLQKFMDYYLPVSYTHLDVYKRQVLDVLTHPLHIRVMIVFFNDGIKLFALDLRKLHAAKFPFALR